MIADPSIIDFPPLGKFHLTGEVRIPAVGIDYYACDHIPGVALATAQTTARKRIVVRLLNPRLSKLEVRP